jgi:hypothetical protein
MTTSQQLNRTPLILRDAVNCAGAAIVIGATSALAVQLSGEAEQLRGTLGFGFGGVRHTPAQAGCILLHNARFVAGTLLCAAIRPSLRASTQQAVDLLLAALLMLNAAAIGVALGAYGRRAATTIAPHGVPEFAALSLAAGAYMSTRKQAIGGGSLVVIAALCALLLTGAAVLETYASAGGAQ